ncbi:MAG TPA: FoF1 ATP synthase subunit a [Ardenticatenaceae bacterium]|nr:FoF1 ATP synthase subunit a [Ardenticatenaceae bacterium]
MQRILNPRVLVPVIVVLAAMILSRLFLPVPLPGILLPAEPIPIGPITIPNTLLATLLADITLLVLAFLATRNMRDVPTGLQNLFEWMIEGFLGLAEDVAGDNGRRWFPVIMTIFLLVLTANWWELVPGVDSIGVIAHEPGAGHGFELEGSGPLYILRNPAEVEFGEAEAGAEEGEQAEPPAEGEGEAEEEHHLEYGPEIVNGQAYGELLPFIRAAATDLNFTLALSLVTVFLIQFYGIQALGLSYFEKFFNFRGGLMGIFVGLIELASELARIISFAFRLFGNVFAGQVLLFIMAFLVPWLLPMPFYGLELFVGFIQAFVFAMLALVFFSTAIIGHHGDEHH